MSTPINDGGPAFPCIPPDPNPGAYSQFPVGIGMTLRDYFAGKALAGILSSGDVKIDKIISDKFSAATLTQSCYIISKSMLAAREAKL